MHFPLDKREKNQYDEAIKAKRFGFVERGMTNGIRNDRGNVAERTEGRLCSRCV